MFTIILYTNKVHPNVDHNLKIFRNTITSDDELILLNNNRYHLKYRYDKNFKYYHIKGLIKRSIETLLKDKCKNDNIIVIAPHIKITDTFLSKIKSSYNPLYIGTCKTNIILNDQQDIEQDKRIGSTLKSSNVNLSLLIFNKNNAGGMNINYTNYLLNINKKGLKYHLYTETTVYDTSKIKKSSDALTIIYPSGSTLFTNHINKIKHKDDKIYVFPLNRRSTYYYMNKYILKTNTKKIVFLNPKTSIITSKLLDHARNSKSNLLFDKSDKLSNDAIISFNRSDYKPSNTNFKTCSDIQKNLISYLNLNFVDVKDKKTPVLHSNNKYSIIIPFMYNGDRFDIFEACIKCLNKHLKDYNNIEIIVHETASKRYLTDNFIKKYNIKYIYSKWDNLFHRAWALNIPAKYIANGNIFVFMDGDLLITKQWIKELLNSDPNKVYMGWGKLNYMSNTSTKHYIKTGLLTNDYDRIKAPIPEKGAAGGINIIPRKIFFDINGWDESNDKGYGAEDNLLYLKLKALDYIK